MEQKTKFRVLVRTDGAIFPYNEDHLAKDGFKKAWAKREEDGRVFIIEDGDIAALKIASIPAIKNEPETKTPAVQRDSKKIQA